MVFLKEFFQKLDFEKSRQTTKKHEKLPSMQRVEACYSMLYLNHSFFSESPSILVICLERATRMALHINQSGCYCCRKPSTKMDIDMALDELGMLSTITESRKQYLHERSRTRSEGSLVVKNKLNSATIGNSNAYHIVQIDRNFVTGFSDSMKVSDTKLKSELELDPPLPVVNSDDVFVDPRRSSTSPPEEVEVRIESRRKYRCETVSSRNRRILARKRSLQPYEVPWRLTQSFQESDLLSCRQEISESKSNSSSPVKSFSEDSLPRSRSLDNLDFSSFFISDSGEKSDMEAVSRCMKNLNMSDS